MIDIESVFPGNIKVATAGEMREFDRRAIAEFGIPGVVLMENAGRCVFDAIIDTVGLPSHAVLVCGKGNNGGDGFVVARHLRDAGAAVDLFLLGEGVTGDAKINLDIWTKTGGQAIPITGTGELALALDDCDVVVDALFGTGLCKEVTGLAAEVVRAINDSGRPVVSVDIPSGVDADSGRVLGVCVKAECTATFALPKVGLLTFPGAAYTGKLVVGEIGIPHLLYDGIDVELVGGEWVAAHLPKRPEDAHKGTAGTVAVFAGSAGLTGAAAMAAESAMRAGAGLCSLCVPVSLQDIYSIKLTEVTTRGLPETDGRAISVEALPDALAIAERGTASVLGCGVGTDASTCEFVSGFIAESPVPVVVDADGLNCLSLDTSALTSPHAPLVLTPHPKEMARLLGTTTDSVQSNRVESAREAAARFSSIVVLKGARTVIASPEGRVWINPTGSPAMATGGTGDVLAGAIGGLLAQGMSTRDAAICGVYVHGLAGELAGPIGSLAGDVMRAIPQAIENVTGGYSC